MNNNNSQHPRKDRVRNLDGPLSVREAVRHLLPETNTDAHAGCTRAFTLAGEAWVARVAGRSAVGTGTRGHAFLSAIHFCRAERPDEPVREALLPRGRFEGLFEEELRNLFQEARLIVVAEGRRGT